MIDEEKANPRTAPASDSEPTQPAEAEKPDEGNIFGTVITLTIAAIALFGVYFANFVGEVGGKASGALTDALAATVNREKAQVTSNTWLFQDLRAYTHQQILLALADAAQTDADAAESRKQSDTATILRDQAAGYRTEADAEGGFYSSSYVLADGTFDEKSFLEHQFRFESRNRNVNPAKEFEKAEFYFERRKSLDAPSLGLAFTLLFLVFAEMSKTRARYYWFGFSLLIFIVSMAYVVNGALTIGY
ncbi:MAG: hypothetical protein HY257_09390 [Chloroflexi bacterium]|nr:hypothetical protein [Chloroflexota bacterium]